MGSKPELGLFWSNYLISLIDPNIYAFSCCSANIVRTCDFITSQKETSQDAPDESPKDSASSFSLFFWCFFLFSLFFFNPLIHFLSAELFNSSSSPVSCASWGLVSDNKALLLLGISFTLSLATFKKQPDFDLISTSVNPKHLHCSTWKNSRFVLN